MTHTHVTELWTTAEVHNTQLLASLRLDKHADFLEQLTISDAESGRVSHPQNAAGVDLSKIRAVRKFSKEQGVKSDGAMKLQAVDDENDSGNNGCVLPKSKMTTDSVDKLSALALELDRLTGQTQQSLWKADVDSAFRRIPILPGHRSLAWVAYTGPEGPRLVTEIRSSFFF